MLSSPVDLITYSALFVSLYFEVFLLLTFIESSGKLKEVTPAPKKLPKVSIMVPVWNEAQTVAGTLNSLLSLNYPKGKLEIVVIDDGSTDATWDVLQAFKTHPQIALYRKSNGGKYTALNYGLTKITGDLVGCLDADSFVDSEALLRIVARFDDEKTMAATPSIKIKDPQNPIERLQQAEFNLSAFIRYVFSALNTQYITPGPFSLFRKEVFEKIGNYKHAHNTEDMEIAMRMQSHHMKIVNAHDAYVYTYAQPTIKRLYKQRLRWIQGGMENMLDYRFMFFNRQYGTLSLFILPVVGISIFIAFYFLSFVGIHALEKLYQFSSTLTAIGLHAFIPSFSFDWFYIETSAPTLLGLCFGLFIISTIFIGKRISAERVIFGRDVFYYIMLYGLLSPFWFLRAVFNTITSRESSWR